MNPMAVDPNAKKNAIAWMTELPGAIYKETAIGTVELLFDTHRILFDFKNRINLFILSEGFDGRTGATPIHLRDVAHLRSLLSEGPEAVARATWDVNVRSARNFRWDT